MGECLRLFRRVYAEDDFDLGRIAHGSVDLVTGFAELGEILSASVSIFSRRSCAWRCDADAES